MWRLAPAIADEPWTFTSRLASRAAVGAFAVYTPEQDLGFKTWHVGTQADLRLLPAPVFGRLDPLVSLGAGALRTNVRGTPAGDAAIVERTNTSFALTPAIGARLAILPRAGLRADVQDLMAFRGGVTHNPTLSAGLSVSF